MPDPREVDVPLDEHPVVRAEDRHAATSIGLRSRRTDQTSPVAAVEVLRHVIAPGDQIVAEPRLRHGTPQWIASGGAVPLGRLAAALQ